MTAQHTRQLGWGLIGASSIAHRRMIAAINGQPDSQVVAVLSSQLGRAQQFSAEHAIPRAYDSLHALLADTAVDVVYISTTNELHAPQTIAAARAGKHVLCEKPMALAVDDGQAMIDACQAANVVLGINHHLRNAVGLRAIKRLISEGAIGTPLAARVFHAVYLAYGGWRLDRPEAGGGVIFDIIPHDADLLRFLLDDEIVEATALAAQHGMASGTLEDEVMGALRMQSGALAQFHCAFTARHAATGIEIHGTDGALIAEDALTQRSPGRVFLQREDRREPVDVGPPENLDARTVQHFNAAARGEGAPLVAGEDGLRSLAVALAVRESVQTGRTIRLYE